MPDNYELQEYFDYPWSMAINRKLVREPRFDLQPSDQTAANLHERGICWFACFDVRGSSFFSTGFVVS